MGVRGQEEEGEEEVVYVRSTSVDGSAAIGGPRRGRGIVGVINVRFVIGLLVVWVVVVVMVGPETA